MIHQEKSAGGIIFNSNGEVLVVQNKGLSWSLPKGHIEPGEEPLTAAYREIREESGLTNLVLVKELPAYTRPKFDPVKGNDENQQKTIYLFVFTTQETALQPVDPDNPQAIWVSKEKVVSILTNPGDKENIGKFLKDL